VTYSYSGLLVDQSVKEDTSWSYQLSGWLPWNWTYSATLADGTPLPSWITFNPATRTFSGTPPQDQNGSITIAVYAREGSKLVGSDAFTATLARMSPMTRLMTLAPASPMILMIRDAKSMRISVTTRISAIWATVSACS